MRAGTLCLALLAVLAVATGTAAATENTPPLPSAGADQTVTPGTTVYLDANGSVDPDGELASVEWTISPPDGGTESPDCASCFQTHFEATGEGEYAVTVRVTDDAGATRSDTLYVTAESVATPSVSVSAPETTTQGSQTTMTASASSADASLSSLSWVVDGDVVAQESVSGSDASHSLTRSFDTTDNVSVSAVVYDTLGYRGSDNRTVTVRQAPESTTGDGGGDMCSPGYQFCNTRSDGTITTADGTTRIVDSNDEPGVQFYQNGELVELQNPDSSRYISQTDDSYVITGDATLDEAVSDTNTARSIENSNRGKSDPSGSDSGNDGSSNKGGGDGGDAGVGNGGGGGGSSPFDDGGSGSGSGGNKGGDGGGKPK